MDVRTGVAAYFPDRPPTWTEVVLGVLVLVAIAPRIYVDSPSAPALLVGFLAFAVALGPAATTTAGRRIEEWFRRIGVVGRAIVLLTFLASTLLAYRLEAIPSTLVGDAAVGGLLAVILYLAAHVLLTREISGWSTARQ
ncbi:hypothetical protein [Natronobacterium texcoconense]|uniref:Uncharacterized protein n=1 Tax=Natronobacterium texcoconense TaxID=1095778 RepID=A0A1H1IMK7_NATTX|nr:hypothetical protein [Natronobacterium texcoconense]SDR38937.1 hypothetical protein SAMN04489842_3635 [Natronobacterium texcoconense]